MAKKKRKNRISHGMQGVTLCISTTMVLILLGLVVLSVATAHKLSEHMRENFIVTVMLSDEMSVNQGHLMCRDLYHRPYSKHVDYVGKDEALAEQTQALGTDPSEFADGNPFLASLDVNLYSDYANSDSLKWITKELKSKNGVVEVSYQKDLMDSVNRNLRRISIVMLILAALLTCVSFSLINNTVRLGVYAHRFSIRTMKLVGASWGFIRRPFMKRALFSGFMSSLLAVALLAVGVYLLYRQEPEIFNIMTWDVLTITAVAVVVFGLVISLLCTYFSVSRYLKMKASKLYKI